MLTWFTTRTEAAPADRLDWMEALANHVGFSPAWLRPPAVTRSALGCQSSVGSETRTVGPRKPGFWCEFGEFMTGPELLLIAQWLKLVSSCGYIGIQSSNRIIKKCEPVRSWHWATLCRNARFPLDEAERLVTSRTEIDFFFDRYQNVCICICICTSADRSTLMGYSIVIVIHTNIRKVILKEHRSISKS